ncbi:MAG: DUF3604 domain-containing protein [Fidelibacterota bacterium]|nr:MAG: DUF3604 domain-containing protein [Candidatus Neomarinimicrobiota bacterium]
MTITAELPRNGFPVGETCSVEILLRASEDLVPGDTIEVQFPNSWLVVSGPSHTRELQHDNPDGEHYIAVAAEEGGAGFTIEIRKRHLPYPEGIVRHGRHIVATLSEGTVPAGGFVRVRYANTYASHIAETEEVWLRVKGSAPENSVDLITLPGPAEDLRVIAPSGVKPGGEFGVLVVSLDAFENCSSTTYEDECLTTSDGTTVAGGLSFTGSLRVPVSIPMEGVYRFQFRDALSNAVRVGHGGGPYWGDIHIHTKLSHDGYGMEPYRYAREVAGLDFAAVADHWQSLGQAGYDQVRDWAEDAQEAGHFVTLLADERDPGEFTGHHNLYFRGADRFMEAAAVPENPEFADPDRPGHLQAALNPSEAMLIPHHTGLSWRRISEDGRLSMAIDLAACEDGGLRPVMEIYSHHGQSEQWDPQHVLSYEFSRMRKAERRSNVSVAGPYYAQDYWMAGRRLGVIGSSDEHSGRPGLRHGGLAAVWAEELSREGIFDALRSRRCYATTGERILVDFSIAGIDMGCSGRKQKGETLSLKLQVWGTAMLLRVEILRYRFGVDKAFATILSEIPTPEAIDASFELENVVDGGAVYYARVTQEPLEWPDMAWTSPIWVDTTRRR